MLHSSSGSSEHQILHRRPEFWFAVIITVIVILLLVLLGKWIFRGHRPPPATPVVVALARNSDVPVYLSALGTVTPTYSITVRTQINGTLLRVLYREGQMVKAGELLAEIDPRPYQAQLVEYQGQLIRDQALLDNARIDLKRYQTLWKQNSISQQTLATQESLVRQYEGSVQVDKGLIQATQVSLYYCEITSPVDGRIGLRLVDPGNFVTTSDTTGIAVINTLDPITVIFTLAEDDIPEVRQKIYAGQTFYVQAYDRQQTTLLGTGNLITIDNQIDTTTGTVKFRAQFANAENHFFPSQFVNVKLLVKTLQNATLIPTAGIQYSPKGPFVYLLNKNRTVMAKPVTVGVAMGNESVITSGLNPGEFVVVEGADKLTDGAAVSIANARRPTLQLSLLNGRARFAYYHPLQRRFLL